MSKHKPSVNTLFLSDIHLGSSTSHCELLLEFLKHIRFKKLVLVGDIIDLWAIRSKGQGLDESHIKVIRKLLKQAQEGVQVIYITGNHDGGLRQLLDDYPFDKGIVNIQLTNTYDYHALNGRRYIVMHGDQFDNQVRGHRLLNWVGDNIYEGLLKINRRFNRWRSRKGYVYWSLAKAVKSRSSQALKYVHRYQHAATAYAERKGYDGVICGHIHVPAERHFNNTHYLNTGDWQDSCSAIIEHENGDWELLDVPSWLNSQASIKQLKPRVA